MPDLPPLPPSVYVPIAVTLAGVIVVLWASVRRLVRIILKQAKVADPGEEG